MLHKFHKMEMPNATISLVPRFHIEAVQSVMPTKSTDPRWSRRVLGANNIGPGIFQRRLQIVLYYEKASDKDSGWLMAGWIKESLGKALSEQPILAGRLRQGENGDGSFEIVTNDSGARLVEAQAEMNLQEFLDLKEREEAESELVFWEDIDEQSPQFYPLFYVQVTNFKCGGHSIGISCSLLLADPFAMASFLKRWANIHNIMVSKTDTLTLPIFYLPNLIKTNWSSTPSVCSNTSGKKSHSVVFNLGNKFLNLSDDVPKKFAFQCIEEAECKLGRKMPSKISLLVKGTTQDMKVESCLKDGKIQRTSGLMNGVTYASWDVLRAEDIIFNEGHKPTCVSSWISSAFDEGLVMLIQYPDEGTAGMMIIVTFPCEKQI